MYGFADKISTADDLAVQLVGQGKNRGDHIAREFEKLHLDAQIERAIEKPDSRNPVKAIGYIEHSRFIARCPFCGGGEAVNPGGTEGFFCLSCANYMNDGKPLPVVWNWDWKKVAAVLELRPNPLNRNCYPSETLEGIKAENIARGLKVG